MSWPSEVDVSRYPGRIRRDITVESWVADGHVLFTGRLRDRWIGPSAGEEEEIHGYEVTIETAPPELTIVSVEAIPGHLPFPECPAAAQRLQLLIGLNLGRGFTRTAADILKGVEGCTHLLTIVQTIAGERVVANYLRSRVDSETDPSSQARREAMVNACAGWREGGLAIELSRAGRSLPRSARQLDNPQLR
jgi:hypothetical protein